MAEDKKNKKFSFFGLTAANLFFLIALITYFFLLHGWTMPVLNYINETGAYHYGSLNMEIPPTYVTGNHVTILLGLTIALVASFLVREVKENALDIEEARKIVEAYLHNRKKIFTNKGDVIEIHKYHVAENFLVRTHKVNEEEKPLRYILQVNIEDEDGDVVYVKAYVHPFERRIYGFVEIEEPLNGVDSCPSCGKEYDKFTVPPEELKKLKELKQALAND